LSLWNSRDRDDALLQADKINLHGSPVFAVFAEAVEPDLRRLTKHQLPALPRARPENLRRHYRALVRCPRLCPHRFREEAGLAPAFLSTAQYSPNVSSWSYEVMSSHCERNPKSVEARNHRYLPLASKTGHVESARSIGHLLCFTGFHIADEDRVIKRFEATRISNPCGIRRPNRIESPLWHHPRIITDNFGFARFDVKNPNVQVLYPST
jgi:hypothetical protein